MDTLRNNGCGVKYQDDNGNYSLMGFKWHEITSEGRSENDLRYICDYTENPINSRSDFDYIEDISEVEYNRVFEDFENTIGFPVV